jgi:hypothetical protein
MKTILWCSLLAVVLTTPARAGEDCEALAEKRRVVTKTYSVSPKDRLFISNQHGEVRVELWSRNDVRAEITIAGFGSTDEEAQSLLDAVEIEEEREGDLIRFETVYEGKAAVNSWWSRGGTVQNARERGVRINYLVRMPRYLPLDIRSRFGNAIIPEFSAPLTLRTEHGNISAGQLTGVQKDIRVVYGQAIIKNLERGKLDLSHTKLLLDRAAELELAYKHGQMLIGEVDRLIADLSYSRCQIEKLHESAQMKVAFLEKFQLPELMNTVKNLNIESSYSDVFLPVAAGTDMNFNVTVNFANFQYPAERVTLTVPQPPRTPRPPQPPARAKMTRTYQGTVGKGGSKVKITSTYGNVRFER